MLGFDLICEYENWKHSDAEHWPASEREVVMRKPVSFFSQGVKLAGDLYLPDDLARGEKRAGIVLCPAIPECGTSIFRTMPGC